MTTGLRRFAIDVVGIQIDAYTWYRYRRVKRFVSRGPVRTLNVGTGGGFETLFLLRGGNLVTTLELDAGTAARTAERVNRNGYSRMHIGIVGHVCAADLGGPYDQIVMLEVLEHILEDGKAIRSLASCLAPGGKMILSTPTRSHGLLPGDRISSVENGDHVRVGYDGPELDLLLQQNGLATCARKYNGNRLVRRQHITERRLRRLSRPLGVVFGLACRMFLRLVDISWGGWFDQITVATKDQPRTAAPAGPAASSQSADSPNLAAGGLSSRHPL